MRRAALLVYTVAVVVLSSSYTDATASRVPASGSLPGLVLWAWERPTDLRDLDSETGVAFLAQTVIVADRRADASASAAGIDITPRRNPLRVLPHTPLIAVTRIESPRADATLLDEQVLDDLALSIARTAALPRVLAIQIDFDAAESERDVYRRLLTRVRARLPHAMPLSITALASWCVGDSWLDGLPIDEAVPMLFRMGPINEPFASIGVRQSGAAAICRGAIGTSLDEPVPIRIQGRRLYVFNSHPWSPATVARAREIAE